MSSTLDEDLIYEILSVVEEIPEGCVATYGQAGRLVPGWDEQRGLLIMEGVPMKDERHVDIKKCRWDEKGEQYGI